MASVSVIIPTYNRARYIGRAIESVLAQTFNDYEIIVVDDGSTDGTQERLSPYRQRVRYVYQAHTGVSAARNAGIRRAQSAWLAFLDSDDRWLPEKLARQIQCIRETGARICFTEKLICGDHNRPPQAVGGKECGSGRKKLFQDPFELILVRSTGLHVQTMLIAKDLLDEAGCFDESLQVAEDMRLIYTLAFLAPFAFVDEPLTLLERGAGREGLISDAPQVKRQLSEACTAILRDAHDRYQGKDPCVRASLCSQLGCALSGKAVVACADRDYPAARRLAREALHYKSDYRTWLRCVAAWFLPQVVGTRRRRLDSRWLDSRGVSPS
jgi:glycosyltransferase involved in cell wall biosynthesis